MTQNIKLSLSLLVLLAGCASAPQGPVPLPAVAPISTEQTSFEQATFTESLPAIQQPASVAVKQASMEEEAELLVPPLAEPLPDAGLTIEVLEQMALANNPSIGHAAARVRSLRGKYVQVGLPPNPSVGYAASEVGQEGLAGQQGAFVGQDFIGGGKLEKNRAIVAAEIDKAEQALAATRIRVSTDVRMSYYRALVAQQRVELATSLVELMGQAVQASQDLLEAEEIPKAGLLQTEVELQTVEIVLRNAENEVSAAWQQLSAVIGDLALPPQKLAGDPKLLPDELVWEETLGRITTLSPEMAAAVAELSRSRRALNRAYAEPVPDLNTQFMVQYDDSTNFTVGGIQVGIPLPLWNKNQGGIRQAQAEISVASQNIDRVALDLQNRLATTFRDYANARSQAQMYSANILPRAAQTFDLVRIGYSQGEVGYLDLLTAERTYAQTNLAYLDALDALWQSHVKIDGLLLTESLATPPE
ncbi:MAG: TolC family protein [Bythopirellula sp.]|nr:TolC family protein [Bythopirellula sp.]